MDFNKNLFGSTELPIMKYPRLFFTDLLETLGDIDLAAELRESQRDTDYWRCDQRLFLQELAAWSGPEISSVRAPRSEAFRWHINDVLDEHKVTEPTVYIYEVESRLVIAKIEDGSYFIRNYFKSNPYAC